MTKYRIRLAGGRVIGPFEKHQLFDLKAKGHIKGGEEAQVFPTGNWGPIESCDFYPEMMDDNRTKVHAPEVKEDTFIIDLTKLRNQKNEKEIEALDHGTIAPVEQLTETIRITQEEKKVSLDKLDEVVASPKKEGTAVTMSSQGFEIDIPEETENPSHNKTVINPVAQQEIERMRKLQKDAEAKIISDEAAKKEAEEHARQLALEISNENAMVSSDESTQMVRLDKTGLLETALENEMDIEAELKEVQKKQARIDKAAKDAEENDEDEESGAAAKAKKKKIVIVIAAVAILYALLFPAEKPKKPPFRHLEPVIAFPIPFDASDDKKSKVFFNKGLELFNKGTYPSLIKAGENFKGSYENNLDNVIALNYLMRSYAEQLKHSKNKATDAQTVFNLIQSKRSLMLQDPNGVIGLNLFYMTINKQDAAIDVVQKYLKLNPKNVTQDLFAVYLQSLIKGGKIDLAKQFYSALVKAPAKNKYTYTALIEYLMLNQEPDKAMEYLEEAIKRNPQVVYFYLLKAEQLINQGKVDAAVPLLKKAEAMNLEYNNLNRAKFFELKGLAYVLKNKPVEAVKYLTNSLKLNDSDELRVRLAKIEADESSISPETNKLISESKAVKLLIQARDFYDKRNYELALSTAAKASDAFPGHIQSELFLSKVQMKLGLTKQGLETLESLAAKYPDDKSINFALIEAYVETYKFNDAKNRIQNISNPDYRETYEYASVNAKLHMKMGDSLQAMSWLKNSISINPLNDADIFALAEILHKKANFDAARSLLNKCMELDPINPDYRIAYARLIYETKDDQAAIGYLLSLKEDFGDDPKILSEIAIFYYRSGKVKDFQDYKAKLEKEFSTDRSLYDFLIKAAQMDERDADIPPLVEKLLLIEPGDLEAMMTAGRTLFENEKLVESAKWFKRIKDKLPSYPKVLYYLARIDFMAGDAVEARKKVTENMKANGENDDDLVFLAQIHASKEEYVEAENMYKRAQKINPRSYDAIVGLADLSTKRNNHDLALDLYKRAMKLKSDEPIVHKKIGDVYRQLGQGTLAIEAYKLYLDMEPESPHKSNLEAYINLMK